MTVRGSGIAPPGSATPVAAPRAPGAITPILDARTASDWQLAPRLAQLQPGLPYPAQLLARYDDGSFLIRIEDSAIRAHLPDGARVGDQLRLTLLHIQPRPSFLLAPATAPDAPVLSPAARLIAGLLRQPEAETPPLAGRAPLLPQAGAAAETPRLALALRDALGLSGLFYEAHLKQWAEGERSLELLRQEPQARSAGQADALAPRSEGAQLLRQQLDTLEQQRVLWQGELWPGQALEWSVARDDGRGARQQEEAETAAARAWHSRLRLELPRLGAVTASLRLADGRLQLELQAAQPESAGALRAAGASLTAALEGSGAALELLTVRHGTA